MAEELLSREEVNIEDTWKLSDMYETNQDFENDLDKYSKIIEELLLLNGKLSKSADELLMALDKYSDAELIISKAFNYAQRLYDQDTANNEHKAMTAKVMSVYAEKSSEIAFMDPEIIAISDELLEKFYKDNSSLEKYRIYLNEVRRLKAHRLSAELEKVMALTMEMAETASNTYGVLSNADMTFPEVADENNEMIKLSHGRFIKMLESSDRNVRENTFKAYYSSYKQLLNTYASLYNGQVKQLIFNAKMRNYPSTLEAAVDANNVPSYVYYNLIEAVNENLDKLHDYVSLRKKCLAVDELHMYDIYTPMVSDVNRKYSYEEAKEIVVKALEPLGEDYLNVVREAFDNRWIDIYENKGKRSGAYSSTSYGVHPYMLLNFNGNLDSVFTLIHEMGHSLHSYYSNNSQQFIDSQYKIFVAEVASTVNEVLLLEYLLKENEKTGNKKERAYLLNHYLDMFKGTLFRQTQFAEFELETNKMAFEGIDLNAVSLSNLYKELNEKYYGKDMISDEEISYEWARIPHFYYNYYVYQYATSFAASVFVAHNILADKDNTVPGYIDFLSSGSIDSPVNLLKKVGVNLETKKPITEALEVMAEVISEMRKLVE